MTPPPRPPGKRFVLALFAAAFALYAAGFAWPPLGDDRFYVVGQSFLRDPRGLAALLTPRFFFQVLPVANSWRPVWLASVLVDRALLGASFAALRASSAFWHAAGAAALAALCFELTADAAVAAAAGFLFVAHPVHAEVVRVVTYRSDALAFAFGAAALLLHVRAWRSARPGLARAASLALFAAALLSKESAAAVPLLLPVVDSLCPAAPAWRRRARAYGAFALVLLGYLYFRAPRAGYESSDGADAFTALQARAPGFFAPVSQPNPRYPNFLTGDGRRRDPRPWSRALADPWTRARTLLAVQGSSLRRLLWPQPLQGDYAPRPSGSWREPDTAAALAAWLLLAAGAFFWRRRNPLLTAGLLWIPAALVPVSGIVMMRNLTADRYLYFSSAGACLALAALVAAPPTRGPHARRAAQILCGFVAVFWALLGLRRAPDFRSDEAYFAATVAVDPDVPRARFNLGLSEWRDGRLDAADEDLRAALRLWPQSGRVREGYADFLRFRGLDAQAAAVRNEAP